MSEPQEPSAPAEPIYSPSSRTNAPEAAPAPEAPAPEESTPASPLIPDESRPEGLPQEFDSIEALAKSYAELRTKMSADGAPKLPEGTPAEPAEPAKPEAAIDFAKFDAEYGENGALSEESYMELGAKGFTRDAVDNYISGLEAKGAAALSALHSAAGGAESYQDIVNWAAQNLQPNEISAFNAHVTAGGESATMAVKALSATYHAKMGTPPKLLTADGKKTGTGDTYINRQQMVADMRSKAYNDPENPTERMRVNAKLARTKAAGIF